MTRPDEIDIAKGVACPGYRKLLVLEDWKACDHFVEITADEVIQTDSEGNKKVVDIIEQVVCRFPVKRDVHTLCKAGKEDN